MNDGGPAFPQEWKHVSSGAVPQKIDFGMQGGMSLRDYFAGRALSGSVGYGHGTTAEEISADTAARCYRYADAMLAERASGWNGK